LSIWYCHVKTKASPYLIVCCLVDINFISTSICFPTRVVKNIFFWLIVSNQLWEKTFLKEDQDTFFLHNDPSSPFHIIRAPSISYSTDTEEDKDSIRPIGHFVSALYYLRSTTRIQKVSILENILSKEDINIFETDILGILIYLSRKINRRIYHILHCRDLV